MEHEDRLRREDQDETRQEEHRRRAADARVTARLARNTARVFSG